MYAQVFKPIFLYSLNSSMVATNISNAALARGMCSDGLTSSNFRRTRLPNWVLVTLPATISNQEGARAQMSAHTSFFPADFHWRTYYYQIQIYEESFFVGNPFEGPGWTGRACPCTIGSFGQTRFLTKGMKDLF